MAPPLPDHEDADDASELDVVRGDRREEQYENEQSKHAPSPDAGNHGSTRTDKKRQLLSAAQGQTMPGPGPIQRDLLVIRNQNSTLTNPQHSMSRQISEHMSGVLLLH